MDKAIKSISENNCEYSNGSSGEIGLSLTSMISKLLTQVLQPLL